MAARAVVAIFLLLSLAVAQGAIEGRKCTVCRVMAAQLSKRLANEKPRNHLDARHRLDKDGNRYGKVIEFKVSELRAIELMEEPPLCNDMNHYRLDIIPVEGDDEEMWTIIPRQAAPKRSANDTTPVPTEAEERTKKRLLRSACVDILGRWEDDIAAKIKEGVTAANIDRVLCIDVAGYCPPEPEPEVTMEAVDEEEDAGRPVDEL